MSLPRNDSIYVKWQTRRRLKWIAKITGTRPGLPAAEGVTADEVADRLLNEIIEQKYPNIDELERELEHAEKELLAKLVSPPAGIRHL